MAMKKRLALLSTSLCILILALSLAFRVQKVGANETIYIKADGDVDPSDAPISNTNNAIYTFTDDINDSIIVQRDNIIIDGAGYTLRGTGASNSRGIDLTGRSNVTVKNTRITLFEAGIFLEEASNNTIRNNTITYTSSWGIELYLSNDNTISGNFLINNTRSGIQLEDSMDNTLSCNIARSNDVGILLYGSSNNIVQNNTITNSVWYGIKLTVHGNNTLSNNNVTDNKYGFFLLSSDSNTFSFNTIMHNEYGIHLDYSADNLIYRNNFINNTNQAVSGLANTWDNSYPSGGNYWSDYEERYPDAEEIDDSGIWDTPYHIDENNRDRYPLIPEIQQPIVLISLMATMSLAIVLRKKKIIPNSSADIGAY